MSKSLNILDKVYLCIYYLVAIYYIIPLPKSILKLSPVECIYKKKNLKIYSVRLLEFSEDT